MRIVRGDFDVQLRPSGAAIAHIMRKRLSKAEKNGIGIAYCTLVSFNAVEEDVLRYAVDKIDGERTRRGGCMFKVGITHGPYFRFFNRKFGYKWESPPWQHMETIWCSYPKHCAWLEKALISYYRAVEAKGLQNIRNGDDSRPASAPCFVYCVFGRPIYTRT